MKALALSGLLVFGSLAGVAAHAETAPITVIATVKVNPGLEKEFKYAAVEMVEQTRKEGGNISYRLVQSTTNPTEFATIELWKSQADIDEHMKSAHLQKFFGAVGSLFAPGYPVVKTYESSVK